MGAKFLSERPRRGGIKCEFCGRNVPSEKALRSHQNALHSQALKDKAKPGFKRLVKDKPKPSQKVNTQKVTAKVVPKKTEERSNTIRNKAVNGRDKSVVDEDESKRSKETLKGGKEEVKSPVIGYNRPSKRKMPPKTTKDKTTEFQCPRCDKRFPVQFSAQKHIQKNACGENEDEKVVQNAKQIKPIQLDYCIYCDHKFPAPHVCMNQPQPGLGLWYECLGCEQRFRTNKFFDVHVADVHGDGCESMFFPKKEEFNSWKDAMEVQTKCKFLIMGQYNSKEIYRCSNLPTDTNEDVAQFCPATIIVTTHPNGSQVNFYPNHHGHEFKIYTLSDQYKSYSISDLIQQASNKAEIVSDDNDLYLQFKTLMDSIVFDAAKINIDTLKVLIGKALEMTSILTQYDEDEDVLTTVNTSTLICTPRGKQKEDGISKALAGIQSRKRGIEENGHEETQKKSRSTFSLADDKDSDNILKELDTDNKNKSTKNVNQIQPHSFVDSFKQFVDNNIILTKAVGSKPTEKPKKKQIVKTKIGQFKPNLSPKKRHSIATVKEFKYEVKERKNDCNILILKI